MTTLGMLGNARTLRAIIPDEANSIQLPEDVRYCVIKNAGLVPIKLSFGEDPVTDYFTLEIGHSTSEFCILGGSVINSDGVGGSSILEMMLWG